ncbi:MAG: hypothetical protein ACREPM_10510 [Gemmatimonadaceae bacterium]
MRDEVVARLRRAGVATTDRDSPDGLARLLSAVEDFERAVERRGGDLMMDEPVTGDRPVKPDDRSFVLPKRGGAETIPAFIERIAAARSRVVDE